MSNASQGFGCHRIEVIRPSLCIIALGGYDGRKRYAGVLHSAASVFLSQVPRKKSLQEGASSDVCGRPFLSGFKTYWGRKFREN